MIRITVGGLTSLDLKLLNIVTSSKFQILGRNLNLPIVLVLPFFLRYYEEFEYLVSMYRLNTFMTTWERYIAHLYSLSVKKWPTINAKACQSPPLETLKNRPFEVEKTSPSTKTSRKCRYIIAFSLQLNEILRSACRQAFTKRL